MIRGAEQGAQVGHGLFHHGQKERVEMTDERGRHRSRDLWVRVRGAGPEKQDLGGIE
jgi:hypothetical protein